MLHQYVFCSMTYHDHIAVEHYQIMCTSVTVSIAIDVLYAYGNLLSLICAVGIIKLFENNLLVESMLTHGLTGFDF